MCYAKSRLGHMYACENIAWSCATCIPGSCRACTAARQSAQSPSGLFWQQHTLAAPPHLSANWRQQGQEPLQVCPWRASVAERFGLTAENCQVAHFGWAVGLAWGLLRGAWGPLKIACYCSLAACVAASGPRAAARALHDLHVLQWMVGQD